MRYINSRFTCLMFAYLLTMYGAKLRMGRQSKSK